MEKINIGTNAFVYPMPVTLVGANVAGRANFLTVGWVSRVNHDPPMLMVALNRRHHTPAGIRDNGTFSVNCPSADMVAATDYCGLVSGKKTDKSKMFEIFYGETGTAPMVRACPLCIECRLTQIHDLPTNYLIIGEIVAAYSEERYLSDGQPDVHKINPLVLTMPDNRYWTVGEYAGKAWGEGKKWKKLQAG